MMINQCWVFLRRPGAEPVSPSLFELRECPMPEIAPGKVLIASYLCSLDPTIRNALAGPQEVATIVQKGRSQYFDFMDWKPGQVPEWAMLAVVLESQKEGVKAGDIVRVRAPWQRYSVVEDITEVIPRDDGIPLESQLSALGGTGLTAILPINKYAQAQPGETAFVSGGAGAVGTVACQVLKARGCRVVASAGSDSKVRLLTSLGITAFNYKTESYLDALRKHCPQGIDIYYDNVGAEALEAVLEVMNDFGRIIACGTISQYDKPPEARYGVKNLFHIVAKRITFQGFLVWPGRQFPMEEFDVAKAQLREMLKSGELLDHHTVLDGFDQLPAALCGLFNGTNLGKMLVRVPEAFAGPQAR